MSEIISFFEVEVKIDSETLDEIHAVIERQRYTIDFLNGVIDAFKSELEEARRPLAAIAPPSHGDMLAAALRAPPYETGLRT